MSYRFNLWPGDRQKGKRDKRLTFAFIGLTIIVFSFVLVTRRYLSIYSPKGPHTTLAKQAYEAVFESQIPIIHDGYHFYQRYLCTLTSLQSR